MTTKQADLEAAIKQVGYAAALRTIAEMMARDAADHRDDADEDEESDEDGADESRQHAEDLDGFAGEVEEIAGRYEEWYK